MDILLPHQTGRGMLTEVTHSNSQAEWEKKKSTTLFIQKTHVTLSYMGHYLLSLSLYFPLRFNGISHYLLFRTATCCHRALPFLSQ